MAKIASKGGVFTAPPLVVVVRYDDGKHYVHDGHHRVLAIYCGGRDVLYKEEYEFAEGTFKECNSIIWEQGFVTPFDPRTEVML